MKRRVIVFFSLILAISICFSQLTACRNGNVESEDHSHDIPYSTAFISSSAPDGFATPNTISFCSDTGNYPAVVKNVLPLEITQFSAKLKHSPRSEHFNSYIPKKIHSLLPILDYAIYYGYNKICIPTTEFDGATVFASSRELKMIYHINDKGIAARDVSSFVNDAGETVNYVFVSIMGLNGADADNYRQAVDEAIRIVDNIPEGYSEYEKAVYLYRYLTDNVTYYEGDYYGETDWLLIYDALIKKHTVCAGYCEALYVLYNLAGIDCFSIKGYVYGGDYHIWNIAKLGDKYYEFDPTWDAGLLVAEYQFFAVSSEDLLSYYPREVESRVDDYCPPRTESLFEKIDMDDDSAVFQLLTIACSVHNHVHADPLDMLGSIFGDVDESSLKKTADGWMATSVSYDIFYASLQVFMSSDLIDSIFEGYIRNEDGMVAFRPEATCGETYRFCGMEDGNVKIYIFDERGNYTVGKAEYQIGVNGDYLVLDKLEITAG